jgi:hypothetical protein
VPEGYQLNFSWILKLLSGTKIFKLQNLCGNQLISSQIFNEDFYLPLYLPLCTEHSPWRQDLYRKIQ